MFFEESDVFFLEGFRPVVFALVSNVIGDGVYVGFADGKSGVSILPCEHIHVGKRVVNPCRGSALDQLGDLRWSERGRGSKQKMDMIVHPADLDRNHLVFLRDSGHVGPDALFGIRGDPSFPVFCAEDEVVIKAGECVGHGKSEFTGFRDHPSRRDGG